jgi:hypothetical protein
MQESRSDPPRITKDLITNRLGQMIEADAVPVGRFSRTFRPGQIAPNPTLIAVDETITMSPNVAGIRITVDRGTLLSDIMKQYGPGDYHWAACMDCPLLPRPVKQVFDSEWVLSFEEYMAKYGGRK